MLPGPEEAWLTDARGNRYTSELRLIAVDNECSLLLSGSGEVIQPTDGVIAIGSGGNYARAAALALLGATDLAADEIVQSSLGIAGDICVYTNQQLHIEVLG